MLTKQEIQDIIHRTICDIWKTYISLDYNSGYLLKEDTLKNSFYHYLRMRLEHLFLKNNIRVFTEFTDGVFSGSRLRPDMVITYIDNSKENPYDLLCVIEFKYKKGFTTSKTIYHDYDKLRGYVKNLHITCPLYMATIWEYEDEPTSWQNNKKYKITELNASYKPNSKEIQFYIVPQQNF